MTDRESAPSTTVACPVCQGRGCSECGGTGQHVTTHLDVGEGVQVRVRGDAPLTPQGERAIVAVARAAAATLEPVWRDDFESSNVARIAWVPSGTPGSGRPLRAKDASGRVLGALLVQWRASEKISRYRDVPEGELDRILESQSVGAAVHTIKHRYPHEYVRMDEKAQAHD
jgi:hypothetical protein